MNETKIKTNDEGIANSAARILPRGTVCLSRTASVGFVAIMGQPMSTSQDFANWVCGDEIDPEFLMYSFIRSRQELRALSTGATHKTIYMPTLEEFHICLPERQEQERIIFDLKLSLSEVQKARAAIARQLEDVSSLANSIIMNSVNRNNTSKQSLGTVLAEVKRGVGAEWRDYPVLGATRDGVAPAREQPGKLAKKYKPVFPGTVFYNPMRILIGSIAFVDDGDVPGITSPDYVVLQGKDGIVDSRWFYYWLRSPLGVQCISDLARGAVRERLLFSRLAEAEIELPPFTYQQEASMAVRDLRDMQGSFNTQLREVSLLSAKILSAAFESRI